MTAIRNRTKALRLFALAAMVSMLTVLITASPAFAQTDPVGSLQTAATGAAGDAVGLVVAVVTITLAVMFGLWAIKKARSG